MMDILFSVLLTFDTLFRSAFGWV